MTTRPAVSISADDDDRHTTRRVYALPSEERANVGRQFVGFVCELEIETIRGSGVDTTTAAVVGVARNMSGTADGYMLVTSPDTGGRDPTRLEAYSLATVRSIRTVARF